MNDNLIINEINKLLLDPEFEKLEKKLKLFNLFKLLQIEFNENRISLILKWLLDPNENHNFGEYLLKKFLSNVITLNEERDNFDKTFFSILNIDTMNLSNTFVQTEEIIIIGDKRKRGDISILNEENKMYVLIENKIFSDESEEQTKSYVEGVNKLYPDTEYNKLFIYLHPEGKEAEAIEFISLSYSALIKVLKEVLEVKKDNVPEGPKFFIEQFISNLEETIMNEGEINELCLRLYEKHRLAFDAVFERRPSRKYYYEYLGKGVVEKLNDDWTYRAENSFCEIHKKNWSNVLKSDRNDTPFLHYEFSYLPRSLSIFIHIENWAGESNVSLLRKHIKNTNLDMKGFDINSDSRTIYKKRVRSKIDQEKFENELNKGIDQMVTIIQKTEKHFDEAIKKFSG